MCIDVVRLRYGLVNPRPLIPQQQSGVAGPGALPKKRPKRGGKQRRRWRGSQQPAPSNWGSNMQLSCGFMTWGAQLAQLLSAAWTLGRGDLATITVVTATWLSFASSREFYCLYHWGPNNTLLGNASLNDTTVRKETPYMVCLMWSLWYKYCCISSVGGGVVETLEKGVTFVSASGVRTLPCAEHLPLWALSFR